ncbi:MAG: LacI family DNA-binding transcriptional regulator, partial [Rhodobacteraceae bacterium]|nr:LacI family DNA-binding transcriptional regulator [Paracoccaceae bacterium]
MTANHPDLASEGSGLPDRVPAVSPKPTLRTVAQSTGFAVTTVSRALANDPLIAKTTREKIFRAADELVYVPDRAAQRLRTGRTNVIALVLDPHREVNDFSKFNDIGFVRAHSGHTVPPQLDAVSTWRRPDAADTVHCQESPGRRVGLCAYRTKRRA